MPRDTVSPRQGEKSAQWGEGQAGTWASGCSRQGPWEGTEGTSALRATQQGRGRALGLAGQ